jgi:hypothetical protein
MDAEPPRQAFELGISAVAGASFWGLYHLATLMRGGRKIEPQHWVRAAITVAMGIVAGVLVAEFLGPALIPLVPITGLRDPYVVGFILGAASWELAPFVFRGVRAFGAKKVKEAGE